MSGAHRHALYIDGTSPLHRLTPQTKLAAHVGFVFAVVATPREAFWAFAVYAVIGLACVRLARIGMLRALRRLVIEVPFVLFAVLLPFVGTGERVDVGGFALSVEGLWGAWNILAKATIGTLATVVLASTTPAPQILRGLERLHVPTAFVAIAGFMVRYADVIADEMRRMRIARESRGFQGRWLWQGRAVAASAGSMFVRSYERGERVFLAMRSRGYDGTSPPIGGEAASRTEWLAAAALPLAGACIAIAAWVGR